MYCRIRSSVLIAPPRVVPGSWSDQGAAGAAARDDTEPAPEEVGMRIGASGLLIMLALVGPPAAPAAGTRAHTPFERGLDPTAVLAPKAGALWGAYVPADGHNGETQREAITHVEAEVGRKLVLDRRFTLWDEAWPTAADLASRD